MRMALPAVYGERLDAAVALALGDFRSVVRKGTSIPYITHLFSVMSLVGEYGGDEDQLIAAVLHDWLEDVPGARVEVLEARFGPRVASLVAGLSDSVGHPKPPWRERKERYLGHLRVASPDLKLISAADKVHNCASIRRDLADVGPAIFDRFTGGRDGTLWYYEELGVALREDWRHPLGDRVIAEAAGLRREAELVSR
jgi:(p)ppGpp synthase/HD superfamily hydrolase